MARQRLNGGRVALLIAALATTALVSAATLSRVRAEGTIVIGIDAPYGKLEFFREDGQLAGIDVDVATEVAQSLGAVPRFEVMPFSELFGALDAGRVDLVVSAVSITADRQRRMRFSVPYHDAALRVAIRKDDDRINALSDLPGMRLGVLAGTVGEDFARESELVDETLVRRFTDDDARVAALESGDVDAIVVHFSLDGHPTLRTLSEPIAQSYYGIAARLDDADLVVEVDRALRRMKRSGRLRAIVRSYGP